MKPIFCGNFEYDAREPDLERLFRRYGRVDRVDMKSGFAFIYMEDERDGEDAIRGLDQIEFGRKGRRLRVEWTKQERGNRRPGGGSKRSANTRPSKTLFVINFDPYQTRTRDLERHFDPYGKIVNVRIRRNFAFIQFETQGDATRALEATHQSKLMDSFISVEYAIRDDNEKGNGYSPHRSRDRSPARRGRSPSPYRRERGSPDYGHGPSRSPYQRGRASPDYGRRSSPSPNERVRANSDYGRGLRPNPYGREGANSHDSRDLSRSPHRRDDRGVSYSPHRRDTRLSPHRRDGHFLSPSPQRSDDRALSPIRRSDDRPLSPSPPRRNDDRPQRASLSPYMRDGGGRLSPSPPREDGIELSPSPRRGKRVSPDRAREASPDLKAELRNSPNYDD